MNPVDYCCNENTERDRPAGMAWGLADASLEEIVSRAHLRWANEQFHKHIKQFLGADDFQGWSWRGFHHHLAVVLPAQAFIAGQWLETGEEFGGFDSFEEFARRLDRVSTIQRLKDECGFDHETAEEVGVDMPTVFSEGERVSNLPRSQPIVIGFSTEFEQTSDSPKSAVCRLISERLFPPMEFVLPAVH